VAPRVTALVEVRGGVRVELDGRPWRTLPAVAVARCGLLVGTGLERPVARALRRELRRADALAIAAAALARRDLPARTVAARLERRGVAPAARAAALEALQAAGHVDDERFAAVRAAALARRGYGDEAIRFRLEQDGASAQAIADALEALPHEHERAAALVARSGRTPRTARRLAAHGFAADTVEALFS